MRVSWIGAASALALSCACGPKAGDTEGESEDGGSSDAPTIADCSMLGPSGGPVAGTITATGFPASCNPRDAVELPEGYTCCSDDPQAIGGALPSYQGRADVGDVPVFADANNGLGTWGMCVRIADIPPGFGLMASQAAGCPLPCNPTWSSVDVADVCGGEIFKCCQTVELQVEDCVLGEDGMWRPATGVDIFEGRSTWGPSAHRTHQDPNGVGCTSFAGSADISDPAYADCLEHLTVANQRGYCMSVQACPPIEDPCAALNG